MDHVSLRQWFAVGAAMAVFHLAVWFGVGMPYWKGLGLY